MQMTPAPALGIGSEKARKSLTFLGQPWGEALESLENSLSPFGKAFGKPVTFGTALCIVCCCLSSRCSGKKGKVEGNCIKRTLGIAFEKIFEKSPWKVLVDEALSSLACLPRGILRRGEQRFSRHVRHPKEAKRPSQRFAREKFSTASSRCCAKD